MRWRESFTNPVFHIPLNLFLEITVVLGDAQAIDPELFRTWVIPIFSYRLHNFITVVRMTASVFPFPTIAVDAQLFVFGYFHKKDLNIARGKETIHSFINLKGSSKIAS